MPFTMKTMTARPQRRRPSYPVTSVDNALRLILMLRDLGEVRGREAAATLGISPSSVHRLMSMLVYRGFAVQGDSRAYLPGPSIRVSPAGTDARWLIDLVKPHLAELSLQLGEATYFEILTGTDIRFLVTVEGGVPQQAGDRNGFVIPAHASSAGRAILANMADDNIEALFGESSGFPDIQRRALEAELRKVRNRGYALSVEEVETGIVSAAVPLRVRGLEPPAAISTAGPRSRLGSISSPETISLLMAARDAIEQDVLRAPRKTAPLIPRHGEQPPNPSPARRSSDDLISGADAPQRLRSATQK